MSLTVSIYELLRLAPLLSIIFHLVCTGKVVPTSDEFNALAVALDIKETVSHCHISCIGRRLIHLIRPLKMLPTLPSKRGYCYEGPSDICIIMLSPILLGLPV